MQTTLETLGQLERRLNVAVPIAQIEGEVAEAAREAREDREDRRLPPRPRAAQDGRAAVRSADSLRRDRRRRAEELQRGGARQQPARRRLSAHRAAPARKREGRRRRTGRARVLGRVRGVSRRRASATSSAIHDRAPGGRSDDADVDRTLDVLRKQRATWSPAGRPAAKGDRVVVDFTGTHRRRRVPGRPGEGLRDRARRGPHAPRVRGRGDGHARRASSKTFPLTFPADYHGKEVAGKTAQFTLDVKEVNARRRCRRSTTRSRRAFGIASGRSTTCAPRSNRT